MCGRFTFTVNPADLQDAFENYHVPPKIRPPLQYRAHPAGSCHSQ
jgi:putative SOS response-associated peptidase YedK